MGTSDAPSISPGRRAAINRALLRWYRVHGRSLAFRRRRDPYAVLVAEVMLQQTQARRVEPVWEAFMARFPTVEALAEARPAEPIRAWAGLGYNGRAVRLQRAARVVVAEHRGRVPGEVAALERLPGIGPYTARAVAATAFGRPVAAMDTNVGRVVARVAGLERSPEGARDGSRAGGRGRATRRSVLQRVADDWVARGRAAEWTHAVMDLGATLCRPRDPLCGACPLRTFCAHAAADRALGPAIPVRRAAPRAARPAAVVSRPFASTRRWLRGRLLARLREAADGEWLDLSAPLGSHSARGVADALAHLAAEGLIERDAAGRARLPGVPG